MFWIFASVALILGVTSPGFRKALGYGALSIVALLVLMAIIGSLHTASAPL